MTASSTALRHDVHVQFGMLVESQVPAHTAGGGDHLQRARDAEDGDQVDEPPAAPAADEEARAFHRAVANVEQPVTAHAVTFAAFERLLE
jgi:hypothetical protein